jgi:hypothetical protein
VPATVDAVSEGGRYALIRATTFMQSPLTTDVSEEGAGPFDQIFYRYDAEAGSLEYIGRFNLFNDGAGLIQMSADGQTIAFESGAQLVPEATPSATNIYVWHDGDLRYVATADADSKATVPTAFLRGLSENARYLAFTDNSTAIAAKVGFDNISPGCPTSGGTPGPCDEAFVYDVEADALSCASCHPATGSVPHYGARDNEYGAGTNAMDRRQAQMVANDGTVFFTTKDGLLPQDGNGDSDVYASRQGVLRLVSTAKQGAGARFLEATADGQSIFIDTDAQIDPRDDDNQRDIYVTRRGAGFPYVAPATPAPCSGPDCRGPLPRTPGVPVPSTDQAGAAGPAGETRPEPKVKISLVRGERRGALVRVTLRASQRGEIRISGKGVTPASMTVKEAGTYRVSVRLTTKTRRQLRQGKRFVAKLRITLRPAFGRTATTTYRRTLKG